MASRFLFGALLLPVIANGFNVPTQWFRRPGFEMNVQTTPRHLQVDLSGPFYASQPPADNNGSLTNFGQHERCHVILSHRNDEFVDVQMGPFGHHQVSLFSNKRRVRYSLPATLQTWITGSAWTGKLLIPLNYLPEHPTGISAFNIHMDGPHLRTWSMNPLPEKGGEIDVHFPSLYTPVTVVRADDDLDESDDQLWNYARKGILAYEIEDDDSELQPVFYTTFQGFQKGVECNLTAPLKRNGIPAKAAYLLFKNERGDTTELELFPSGSLIIRTYVDNNVEIQNDIPSNRIDYITTSDANVWQASLLLAPEYFPTDSDDVNIIVEHQDAKLGATTSKYWSGTASDSQQEQKFSPQRYRKFERDLLLMENDKPSQFWQNILSKQPQPTPIVRASSPNDPTSIEQMDETSGEDVTHYQKVAVPKAPGASRQLSDTHEKQKPVADTPQLEEEITTREELTGNQFHAAQRQPTNEQLEEGSQESQKQDQIDSEPLILINRKDFSKSILSESDVPENTLKHPYKERSHANTFKVVINPQLKEGRVNPEIIVEEIEAESDNEEVPAPFVSQEDSPHLKLRILDDAPLLASLLSENPNASSDGIATLQPDILETTLSPEIDQSFTLEPESVDILEPVDVTTNPPENSPEIYHIVKAEEVPVTIISEPEMLEPIKYQPTEDLKIVHPLRKLGRIINNRPQRRRNQVVAPKQQLSLEEQLLEFLNQRVKNRKSRKPTSQINELRISELEDIFARDSMFTPDEMNLDGKLTVDTSSAMDEIVILDSLAPGSTLFPPSHPICFTPGLVADERRCEVFYECVLSNNQWQMFSWMCKPGTIFDPYRLACLAGTCV